MDKSLFKIYLQLLLPKLILAETDRNFGKNAEYFGMPFQDYATSLLFELPELEEHALNYSPQRREKTEQIVNK